MIRPSFSMVLTGAGGGLGQAIARELAPDCKAMVLAGHTPAKLEALRQELRSQRPDLPISLVSGDLRLADTRSRIVDAAHALPEKINLAINNAGTSDFHAFESQSGDAMERQLAVNLLAPMRLTQTLLPLLRQSPAAQIVNIGSIFGYLGYPGFAAYCASKFGLRGYSQALRRELADTGIDVRYFAPRAIRTDLNSPAVSAMNRELRNIEDDPQAVAKKLSRFLAGSAWECKVGFPERLYVFLNQLAPAINDGGIRRQLQTIRRHLPAPARRSTTPKGVIP